MRYIEHIILYKFLLSLSEDVYDFIMFIGFFAVSSLTYHDGSCHEVDPGALH